MGVRRELDYAVLGKDLAHTSAPRQLFTHLVLARRFFQGARERRFGEFLRHDDDAVDVSENPVPRANGAVADADRLTVADPIETALGIQRRKTGSEDGEI